LKVFVENTTAGAIVDNAHLYEFIYNPNHTISAFSAAGINPCLWLLQRSHDGFLIDA